MLRTTPFAGLVRFGNAYVELFRNIPLLVQMFLWYFVLPELVPRDVRHLAQAIARRLVLHRGGRARPLHVGARRRAGARRDFEPAARPAPRRARARPHPAADLLYVLLPMTFRIILPPLTSELLNTIKNSAVALTIGLMELTARARAMQEFSLPGVRGIHRRDDHLHRHQHRGDLRHADRRAPHRGAGLSRLQGAGRRALNAMFSNFDFDVIWRSLPYLFYQGMTFTLMLTALATPAASSIGTLLALMRLSGIAPLTLPAAGYVNLMRSVPFVLMIFWFYFLVPYIGQWVTAVVAAAAGRRLQLRASSPSRCLRRRSSARSCARAFSRSRAARWRRRRRSA